MCRFTHSQGFGIQSPPVRRLDKGVINAHYSCDAYTDLEQVFPQQDQLTLKLACLYLRIARMTRVKQWALCTHQNDVYCTYAQVGCRTASLVDVHEVSGVDKIAASNVLVTTMEDNRWPMCEAFANRAYERSILIVEGTHTSKKAKMCWRELANNTHTGVAFSLYGYGIVFFDHTRNKQVYIINL